MLSIFSRGLRELLHGVLALCGTNGALRATISRKLEVAGRGSSDSENVEYVCISRFSVFIEVVHDHCLVFFLRFNYLVAALG